MSDAKPDYTGEIARSVRALRDHYLARCEALDFVARHRAVIAVNAWAEACEVCAAASAGADLSSYSIAGRSVTRSDADALRRRLPVLEEEMLSALGMGGGVLRADLRGAFL